MKTMICGILTGILFLACTTPVFSAWDESRAGEKIYDLGTKTADFELDTTKYRVARFTMGANLTLTLTPLSTGNKILSGLITIIQDGTGSRVITMTLGANLKTASAGAIVLTTTPSAIDEIVWVWKGDTTDANGGFYELSIEKDIRGS